MLTIAAATLNALAPGQSGQRAIRQQQIISGMADPFSTTLDMYEINTPLRIAHFLSQIAEESDGFCTTEEYASGQAYEGRKDLGNTTPGDGVLFKGRGLIQLTGRANYMAVGAALKLDLVVQPQSVSDPYVYLLVSCVFWQKNNINKYADQDDVISVTQVVNGGQNGIDARKAYLAKAKLLLAPLVASAALPPGGGMAVLYRGSSGAAVTRLQSQLSAKGYPVALDGDFGPATELAVQHFQAQAGLTVDGVVGAQTWGLLSGGGAP
jgi:putative chitinase